MLKLRLAAAAAGDVREIRIYSKAQFGAPVARDYLLGLQRPIGLLRQRSRIGGEEDDLGAEVRGFSFRSHRIFYRVEAETPVVLRILHHARDARRWIGDEE